MDFDDAYANAAHIPEGAAFPARWAAAAAAFRAAHPPAPGWGPGDLFLTRGQPRGLAVLVHGGYWMETGPRDWSHLAAGALARGWAVALPFYDPAPRARLHEMCGQVARQVESAAARIAGPVALAGHSAGGQLAARLVCDDSPLSPAVRDRVRACVPISGLFDLRPLRRTAMNATLGLDAAQAAGESPLFHEPLPGIPVALWVGAAERPAFLRQSRLLAEAWQGLGAEVSLTVERGRHHFDILDGLTDPGHPLTRALTPADRPAG